MQDVHQKFKQYGSNAKIWINKCKLLLPEIKKQAIWHKKGFGSIYEYAAKLAGLSRGQVDDALWILNKIQDKPALMEVAQKKGVNAVRPVATISTEKTQEFWAHKAEIMPKNTLEVYVRESRPSTTKTQKTIIITVSQETANKLENIKGDRDWEDVIKEFLDTKTEKPEPVESKGSYIPQNIKNYVIEKFNGQCAFPRCCKNYNQLHHSYRFSLTQVHDPDKIFPLCNAHHNLAHQGLINNEGEMPDKWEVRDYADFDHPKFEIDEYVQKCRSI